jgi:hypothetical protein
MILPHPAQNEARAISIVNQLAPSIPLDGVWEFALGEPVAWHPILVPGCWEAQGYAKTSDGPAYYRRQVLIPADWHGQPIYLEFDAVSYACTVYVNGTQVGQHIGLWTPFALDISTAAQPGQSNQIEVVVYRPGIAAGASFPMRTTLAGFLPDVATPFGGLWQGARLRAVAAGLCNVHMDADPGTGNLHVRCGHFVTHDSSPLLLHVVVAEAGQPLIHSQVHFNPQGWADVTLTVAEPRLWSPATPTRYQVTLHLQQGEQIVATHSQRIGFRTLTTDSEQLLFNGDPLCLRGALSWGWNPATIAPWYTADEARALGFNLIKLCLFIPNQTYYDIADEEGMLLWQEWPLWLPEMTDELRTRLVSEYAEYMQLTRHHPSVVLYSLGCELNQSVDQALLQQLDALARQSVQHVLFCDNSGSGEAYGGLAVDFADFSDYHTYGDIHFLEPTLDHWRRDWQTPRPWIFGEFCDADGFRDLAEIVRANDGLKPWWMTDEIWTHTWRSEVRALLEADTRLVQANTGFSPGQLVRIANAQSYMVRKFTLEAVRKRAAVKGYVITGLRDTPIATSGVFDDLDRPKWAPEHFRQINDAAILCLEVGRSRHWVHGGDRAEHLDLYNWWAGEPVRLHLILNHTATQPVTAGVAHWQLLGNGEQILATGQIEITRALTAQRPGEVGVIEFTMPAVDQAVELRLAVSLQSAEVVCANRWPLWCYPKVTFDPDNVLLYDPARLLDNEWAKVGLRTNLARSFAASRKVVITTALDDLLLAYLQNRGAALLLQLDDGPLPVRRGPFWREALKLLTPHPLWQDFPNQGYADMQFFGLASDVIFDTARLTAALPGMANFTPILRRLDAREFTLGEYLFAAQVGAGRLIGCALRLPGGAGHQPTGLQRNVAGQYLLHHLLRDLAV